jgi:cytochrome c556
MNRHASAVAALLAILGLSACAEREPVANVDPAIVDAIKARQANFREMGAASKNIDDALKAGNAISPPVTMAAKQIENFAGQQKYWFPAGSGPETGVETAAKAEIWSQPQQFEQRQQALIDAASALTEVASEDSRAAFVEQFRRVGQTCKDCHDTFREPED